MSVKGNPNSPNVDGIVDELLTLWRKDAVIVADLLVHVSRREL